ncbi:Apolipoprotein N-acyltransferase [Tropicibacter naphthalenivorans]|uniref:Apolipoprotein N-acyltransferase n=2 Tax=Tropicibacter naphthalenivorans TaxID=441103 RepID=A0A0P1H0N6_9RHOB|nr:Apolipoprotein N-acyltransferase [Tropicibacter naphthalenivorans]SMD07088.1 Apolipoprotein N-acyltransferase [Tropicibacter naphthalenivorans]
MGLGLAPYDLWYLAFTGYVVAIWLFQAAPRGVFAVGTGWAVGLGYFGFSLGWIIEPFFVDPSTIWMAPFALVGMAGGLALFWALAFWIAAHAPRRPLLALVLAWTGAELARAYVFTGFPWGMVSYMWSSVAPIQLASLLGPHGLNLATLATAAMFAAAIPRGGLRLLPAVLGVTSLLVLFGVGLILTPPYQDLSGRPVVRLIQPNAPQHEKWDPLKIPMFFDRQLRLTAGPPKDDFTEPQLVVWPETSVPHLLHRAGDALGLITHAAGSAQVVVGIQRAQDGNYYNSLALMDGTGALRQVYDKHHLVPFGEYMPAEAVFRRWNILGLASRAEGGYSAGPGPELLDLGPLGKALPLICYEAVFPQDVYRTPERPDFLLQITNDAWFGEWSGPYQHLEQARVRAIEQGLPMLRAANTGVSAVIDGAGRVLTELPLGRAGYVDAYLPPPLRLTLYSQFGDFPVLLLMFLSVLGFIRAVRVNSD